MTRHHIAHAALLCVLFASPSSASAEPPDDERAAFSALCEDYQWTATRGIEGIDEGCGARVAVDIVRPGRQAARLTFLDGALEYSTGEAVRDPGGASVTLTIEGDQACLSSTSTEDGATDPCIAQALRDGLCVPLDPNEP